jgi:hypothetical protein
MSSLPTPVTDKLCKAKISLRVTVQLSGEAPAYCFIAENEEGAYTQRSRRRPISCFPG